MNRTFGTYALMVSVVLWGVLIGGVVYSHIVVIPVFLSHLPDSSVVVNGKYGVQEIMFWMLIHPLTILSLIVSLAANRRDHSRRNMIVLSLLVYLVVIVATYIYFVPELLAFQNSPNLGGSEAEWLVRGDRWQHLSWIRGTIMFLAFIPLLFALSSRAKEENSPQ